MTVRFITAWNGRSAGQVETFAAEVETALIAGRLARASTENDNAGGTDLQAQITGHETEITALQVIASTAGNAYADDAAAAAGGVPVGGLYNTAGAVKVRQA